MIIIKITSSTTNILKATFVKYFSNSAVRTPLYFGNNAFHHNNKVHISEISFRLSPLTTADSSFPPTKCQCPTGICHTALRGYARPFHPIYGSQCFTAWEQTNNKCSNRLVFDLFIGASHNLILYTVFFSLI